MTNNHINQRKIHYKKKFINYDLVILDEFGYISFDKESSELLFNLLSMRNETKSLIITTKFTFNRWYSYLIRIRKTLEWLKNNTLSTKLEGQFHINKYT